jgi:3D (Asp-Asp-Asp) domain-containing protein
VRLTYTDPIIPEKSRVAGGKVLTKSDVTATITQDGAPLPNIPVTLQSDRGAQDTIGSAGSTNASGSATAKVETRNQPGTSMITLQSSDISNVQIAPIVWLPAQYEKDFLVTCYVLSSEQDFVSTPLIGPVKGLPKDKKYREGFIRDVRMQGSGVAIDGTNIRWNAGNRYSIQSCPLTSTGACAVDGTTVAVDPTVIPRPSRIMIHSVGIRLAQDGGGWIDDYHIDEFFGTRRKECEKRGRQRYRVDFSNY